MCAGEGFPRENFRLKAPRKARLYVRDALGVVAVPHAVVYVSYLTIGPSRDVYVRRGVVCMCRCKNKSNSTIIDSIAMDSIEEYKWAYSSSK